MHSFLTRDGVAPVAFRRLALKELSHYKNVTFCPEGVTAATRNASGLFHVVVGEHKPVACRKLLIATGVIDNLPDVAGIEEFFGTNVFQCPYCDGWELRGEPTAVYGKGRRGFDMARALTAWTSDIALCTDGPSSLTRTEKSHLQRNGIRVFEERISCLEGEAGQMRAIAFRGGHSLPRSALFFNTPSSGQSRLAESLGCKFARHGGIKCGQYEATSVPGVFVAGNIIKDVQLAIVAAAEGARAAFGINRALTREDFSKKATGSGRIEHPPLENTAINRRRSAGA
jgi:thioredoxin reductase